VPCPKKLWTNDHRESKVSALDQEFNVEYARVNPITCGGSRKEEKEIRSHGTGGGRKEKGNGLGNDVGIGMRRGCLSLRERQARAGVAGKEAVSTLGQLLRGGGGSCEEERGSG